jgi:hypothetical protein
MSSQHKRVLSNPSNTSEGSKQPQKKKTKSSIPTMKIKTPGPTLLEQFDASDIKCDIWLGLCVSHQVVNVLMACLDNSTNTVYRKGDV